MNKYKKYLGKRAIFSKDVVEFDPSLQHLVFKIVGVKKDAKPSGVLLLVEFGSPIDEFTHRAQLVNNKEFWLYGHCNTPEWLSVWRNRPCLYRVLDRSEVQLLEN